MRGARPGLQGTIRRWFARAIAREPAAFIVPERRAALAAGLDLAAVGLAVAPTPRHASVLLVIGVLPQGLAEAAATALAQMPRPRLVLAVGGSPPHAVPADITVPLGQAGLEDGVRQARALLATASWSPDAEIGPPPQADEAQAGHDHAAMGHDHGGHGGHDAVSHADHSGHEEHDAASRERHQDHDHGAGHGHGADSPGDHHGAMGHEAHDEARQEQSGQDHNAMAQEGMDHGGMGKGAAQEEQARERAGMGHEHMEHGEAPHDHGQMDHGDMDHSKMEHDGMDHSAMDHSAMDHGGMHHGMDHAGMDHGAGGFMSMVMMTQDLPRSPDGLPMEWVPAPFGPLFPGLPAGLAPTLTLDGDVVAEVSLAEMATRRGIPETLPGAAATLPDRLAALDPYSPVSYRLLAQRALEVASGEQPDAATVRARVGALEWERVASHLGWLAQFGELLGLDWLADRAAALRLAMARLPHDADATRLRGDIARFTGRVERVPLLQRRLRGIGAIPADTGVPMHGPVARASGIATDARVGDPAYASPALAPIVRQGADAWARLQVRLAEVPQSLDRVSAAGTRILPDALIPSTVSGHGEATVETPRGAATLSIHLHDGQVDHADLHTPVMDHVALVAHVATGSELADALVGIASLDLSPWEAER